MEPDGIKSVPFKVKAAGTQDGLDEGQFVGYASVFGNVDSYGDVVVQGAFTKTLAEWQEKGDPIPLLWGHDFADPFSNIGAIDSAEEDEHGLKVRGTFDLDNPKAVQVYRLAKGRRTTGMSFAYDVRDSEQKDGSTYLTDLHIYEASIVPIGANALAGVEAVKSAASGLIESAKAGRVLSAKNENALRSAHQQLVGAADEIKNVLSVFGDEAGEDQEKASEPPESKSDASADESAPVSDEAPVDVPPVEALAAQISIYRAKGAERSAS